ncbi:substrate-binding periplasmic protein [Leeia oryzae]|uniref:substrate-binding periplasmic protein n=1 Tax=Leeia oryzae TaxID=356662 RepID=UPI0003606FCA|nr:transporter substrate-binding domain-containing protein [Leeia oryzae]
MKRRFACGLLLACTAMYSSATVQPVVNLVASEYPPDTSESMPGGGVMDRQVKRAFELAGYKVNVTYYPWARAYELAKTGRVDGIYDFWMTPERAAYFVGSKPVSDMHFAIYGRLSSKERPRSLNDLRGKRIGIVNGYAYPQEMQPLKNQLDASLADTNNFQKLVMGRVDYVISTIETTNYLAGYSGQSFFDKVYQTDITLSTLSRGVAFPKANPKHLQLQKAFNEGLQKLKLEQKYKAKHPGKKPTLLSYRDLY